MAGSEVETHAKEGTKGMEEVGGEFGTVVGGDMERDAMLREYVRDEDVCNFSGSDCICGRYENTFLGQPVDDHQDGSEAVRSR